jgi:hypothetical protein
MWNSAPFGADREEDRHAFAEASVIHVAAVRRRRRCRDRLSAGRSHAEAADHRVERQLPERGEAVGRALDPGRAAVQVELPPNVLPRRVIELGNEARLDDVRGDQAARDAAGAVRADPVEPHRERVPRLGTLDVERAGLRVAALGDLLTVAVEAAGVDAPGTDRVAARDAEHRLM